MTETNLLALTVEASGAEPEAWAGRCYEIASLLAPRVGGEAVYGHWRGPIAEGSFFGARAGLPFVQHGWVVMPDGSVVDPTRWTFDGAEPYVYAGPSDHYDRGGNINRMAQMGDPPADDGTAPIITLHGPAGEFARLLFGTPALTAQRALWVANLAPSALPSPVARPLFEQLDAADLGAFIPIDNRHEVLGEGGRS